MSLSLVERETIITYNDADGTANVFTASPVIKNKLAKLGEVKTNGGGWEIEVPKAWVRIAPPRKLSSAHKEKLKSAGLNSRFKAN